MRVTQTHSSFSHFFFCDTNSAWLWLVLRVYIGWQWLSAGYEKAINPAWIGENAPKAIIGFFNGALSKTTGEHPDVSSFYAYFIEHIALPNAHLFSYLIPAGEIAVGIGLILGMFTGIAAFFGLVMNFNFMFAGSVSVNPYWIIVELLLVQAWRVSGYIGLDRYISPIWHKMTKG